MTKPSQASAAAVFAALRAYKTQIMSAMPWSIFALLLPGIGNVFIAYVPALIIAQFIKDFGGTPPSTWNEAAPYVLWLGAAWLFGEAIWRVALYMLNIADARGMQNLYTVALQELLRKDMAFFHDNFAGSLTKKVSGFSRNFESFMDTLSFAVFGNVLPLLFASVILWTISPWLVLALISMIALALLCVLPLIKKRQALTTVRETKSNVVAGHVADVIGNIATVQAYGREQEEFATHEHVVGDYIRAAKKSWNFHVTRIDMVIAPLYVITNVIGLVLAILLSDSASSAAAIFVSFNYFANASRVLFEFNRVYRNIENALTDAGQFTELLLNEPDLIESPGAQPITVTKGVIEFKDVVFTYSEARKPLFDGLNLGIRSGEKIALVGHSGGGKSTITKLLLRFNDITSGQLLIDGQEICDATLRSLRHAIAYVPQEPAMFHRSIADNIRYGNQEATDEQVLSAARKAHALEFIEQLPDGFDTLVGERGVKLSGGQRQRIAIARAILKDAPILVLDEATSALDSESEKLIQDALQKLMRGRTSIVIAHRLSTIQTMDRIVVLDHGSVIEQGTHDELRAKKRGTYARLWAHQSGGFIEE